MFDDELYITVTGLQFCYGMKPFHIGSMFALHKEPENEYDLEAVAVVAPALGRVGYVANSPSTVTAGCMSAGRLLDRIPDECVAVVRFMTSSKVIARVYPGMKLKVDVSIEMETCTYPESKLILEGGEEGINDMPMTNPVARNN